jgi:hypothetical protein
MDPKPDNPDLLAHATEFAFHPEGASFGDKEVHYFTVTVARRSAEKWAVLWMNQCWNRKTQSWEHESFPSSRTKKFLRDARFSLEEAVQIAAGKPDTLTVMGKSWLDFKAIHTRQEAERNVGA